MGVAPDNDNQIKELKGDRMPWFARVSRSEINWSPTIDIQKCVKCGMCMNCGKSVFQWGEDGRPFVNKPLECVVGCSTCANLCLGEAISFPPLSDLRGLYKKNHVWSAVRRILLEDGKIPEGRKRSPGGFAGVESVCFILMQTSGRTAWG